MELRLLAARLISNWRSDQVGVWAAALSFFTLFSLVPLVFVVVTIGTTLLRIPGYEESLFTFIRTTFSAEVALTIQQAVAAVATSDDNPYWAAVSIVAFALGGTGVLNQVFDALRHLWGIKASSTHGLWRYIRRRILAFVALLPLALVLLVTFVLSTVWQGMNRFVDQILTIPSWSITVLDGIISMICASFFIGLLFVLFAPKSYTRKSLWLSAGITGLLFTLGRAVVSFFISHSTVVNVYGAAGSLLILLLWIYFSMHVFLFGAVLVKTVNQRD